MPARVNIISPSSSRYQGIPFGTFVKSQIISLTAKDE